MTEPAATHRWISRRWLIRGLRVVILVLVCLGVSGTLRNGWAELGRHQWQVNPLWLLASSVLYLAGLAPMGWFWRRSLLSLGYNPPRLATMYAYFLGHLAKYAPGKGLALVLRVAALRQWVPSLWVAVVSTVLETLTLMAVGACLAAGLAAVVLKLDGTLTALAAGMALMCGLPTLPPVARALTRLGTRRMSRRASVADDPLEKAAEMLHDADRPLGQHEEDLQKINWSLVASGWLAAVVCWTLLGLSMWAVLRAIGVEAVHPLYDLPLLVAAVSLAVVAGFLSFIPGGLIVRDALLLEVLSFKSGEANALVAALLVRLVWLVSEMAACGILYIARRWEQAAAEEAEPAS